MTLRQKMILLMAWGCVFCVLEAFYPSVKAPISAMVPYWKAYMSLMAAGFLQLFFMWAAPDPKDRVSA